VPAIQRATDIARDNRLVDAVEPPHQTNDTAFGAVPPAPAAGLLLVPPPPP
jgi:hypothetical protein